MKDELTKRIRIPYEYIQLARELQKSVFTMSVSISNPWTLSIDTFRTSLRQRVIISFVSAFTYFRMYL